MLKRLVKFIFDHSLMLMLGAAAGVVWANADLGSYSALLHAPLLANPYIGLPHEGGRLIDAHYLVNDILMAFFFLVAGREVWMATRPGGPLDTVRRAALPMICTAGGMAGPALLYTLGALAIGRFAELGRGWAIPCATDIAFSYMAARLIFGKHHPAIPFLLLLAIADDAGGMAILAVFYPQEQVRFAWLALPALAVGGGLIGFVCWQWAPIGLRQAARAARKQ